MGKDLTVRPAPTVMSAFYRRRGEDRVTEVFSTVLGGSPQLLTAFVALVGLPPAHTYEVQTQVKSGSVRIDLEITGIAADGSQVWILWSEHKVDDPLTSTQLENEWRALKLRAASIPHHLVAITLLTPTPGAVAFAASTNSKLFRWRDITKIAKPDCTNQPLTVDNHLLQEWLEFAYNELEAPVEALTTQQVDWMPEVDKALETVAFLIEAGFNRACADVGGGKPRDVDDELHGAPPEGSWLADGGFKLFAKYIADGGFGDVDGPCLVFGGWIEGDNAVSARRTRALHSTLGERGLSIWDEDDRHGGWIEFGLPLSLRELAAHGTLEQQDKLVGDTATCALQMLVAPVT